MRASQRPCVARLTAQKLHEHWRDLTATRFYRDSMHDVVNVQLGLGGASHDNQRQN